MATLMVILAKNYRYLINYLIIITGQWEYVTTPEAVLPNSTFLIPEMPLVPNTIRSIFSFSAYSTISLTTEPTPKSYFCFYSNFVTIYFLLYLIY